MWSSQEIPYNRSHLNNVTNHDRSAPRACRSRVCIRNCTIEFWVQTARQVSAHKSLCRCVMHAIPISCSSKEWLYIQEESSCLTTGSSHFLDRKRCPPSSSACRLCPAKPHKVKFADMANKLHKQRHIDRFAACMCLCCNQTNWFFCSTLANINYEKRHEDMESNHRTPAF